MVSLTYTHWPWELLLASLAPRNINTASISCGSKQFKLKNYISESTGLSDQFNVNVQDGQLEEKKVNKPDSQTQTQSGGPVGFGYKPATSVTGSVLDYVAFGCLSSG